MPIIAKKQGQGELWTPKSIKYEEMLAGCAYNQCVGIGTMYHDECLKEKAGRMFPAFFYSVSSGQCLFFHASSETGKCGSANLSIPLANCWISHCAPACKRKRKKCVNEWRLQVKINCVYVDTGNRPRASSRLVR